MAAHPEVDFDNTERAFARLSTFQLQKRFFVFLILHNRWMMQAGKFFLKAGLAFKLPVRWLVKPAVFRIFCAGETLKEAERVVNSLSKVNVKSVPVYSVESENRERSLNRAMRNIVRMVAFAADHASVPFCAFKITGLGPAKVLEKVSHGETLSDEEANQYRKLKKRLNIICREAWEKDVSVFLDAEETWLQDAIDRLAETMMKQYNTNKAVVYNTYQMYRKDGLKQLKGAFHKATMHQYYLGAKLVRGAYLNQERQRAKSKGKESPVCDSKEATNQQFDQAMKFCLDNKQRVSLCAGTHNEWSTYYLTVLMEKYNVAPDDPNVYFSQLYGMSDHISFNLAMAGYNVTKYLPYGPVNSVIPYLLRRAEENSSTGAQSNRELSLINRELKRRREAG